LKPGYLSHLLVERAGAKSTHPVINEIGAAFCHISCLAVPRRACALITPQAFRFDRFHSVEPDLSARFSARQREIASRLAE